jgi:hypothetical protein
MFVRLRVKGFESSVNKEFQKEKLVKGRGSAVNRALYGGTHRG